MPILYFQYCSHIRKSEAKKTKSIIVLGDLRDIRKIAKGKGMRRLLNAAPFHKLTHIISYKAFQHGLQVFKIKEYNTSRTCHKCKCTGTRKNRASFSCTSCGMQYNADLNGARNILNRAREQGFLGRAMADALKITESSG